MDSDVRPNAQAELNRQDVRRRLPRVRGLEEAAAVGHPRRTRTGRTKPSRGEQKTVAEGARSSPESALWRAATRKSPDSGPGGFTRRLGHGDGKRWQVD